MIFLMAQKQKYFDLTFALASFRIACYRILFLEWILEFPA